MRISRMIVFFVPIKENNASATDFNDIELHTCLELCIFFNQIINTLSISAINATHTHTHIEKESKISILKE